MLYCMFKSHQKSQRGYRVFLSLKTGIIESLFIKMEMTVGEAGLDQSMKDAILDMVNFRCIILDFHQ